MSKSFRTASALELQAIWNKYNYDCQTARDELLGNQKAATKHYNNTRVLISIKSIPYPKKQDQNLRAHEKYLQRLQRAINILDKSIAAFETVRDESFIAIIQDLSDQWNKCAGKMIIKLVNTPKKGDKK